MIILGVNTSLLELRLGGVEPKYYRPTIKSNFHKYQTDFDGIPKRMARSTNMLTF